MDIPKTLEELRVEHEEEFRKAILDLYRRAKEEHGYKPTLLLQMVQQYGPYAAATKIIEIPGQSSGFTKLWELKALELSVEALVWEKYRYLFPPEIVDTCRETLRTYGYFKDKDMMQEMSGSSSEERSATLMPTGNETPQRIQSTAARYERDSMIVAETKRLANVNYADRMRPSKQKTRNRTSNAITSWLWPRVVPTQCRILWLSAPTATQKCIC